MSKKTILIIEDDPDIRELLDFNLRNENYATFLAKTGEEGLQKARAERPDLIILDLMLPGVGGLDVCRALKGDPKTAAVPIVMATAKGEEVDVVTGLELGADDYITKPFSIRVLLARVMAVLRKHARAEVGEDAPIRLGKVYLDPIRHEVEVEDEPIRLTATEFRMLHFLMRYPGRVFSRSQIVDGTQGEDYAVTDRAVDVQVVGLRKKLGAYSDCIETVRGIGYRFSDREI